jgi:hypothetical protein
LITSGHAVKTLESKETKASKEITVTHNSVFAAHRLQCRMTTRQNRHPAFCFLPAQSLPQLRFIQSAQRELPLGSNLVVLRVPLISLRSESI